MQPNPLPSQPYQRLQIQLAALIDATPTGDRLPTEPELARSLGVSRATLREAMRSFEGQGLIRRRQGKGTFVNRHATVIETGLEVLESIETLARRIGLDVSMGALSVSSKNANEELAEKFCVEIGSPLLQVVRVILSDQRPAAYLVDLLPTDVLHQEDLDETFSGSVLDFLLRRGAAPLDRSLTEIQAVAASPEIARALEIQRSDVLLAFDAQLFTLEGRMIDISSSYFIPGYFHFHVMRHVSL